jgi:hypothetical protein
LQTTSWEQIGVGEALQGEIAEGDVVDYPGIGGKSLETAKDRMVGQS